jgi:deferrochelatase/peroxidase EfeB
MEECAMASQAGITNRPQEHVLLAALNFAGDRTPERTRETTSLLQGLVEQELTSDLDETNSESRKDQPSAETGELGFLDDYDRAFLTVTLGIGASGFDALGLAAEERPQDLIPIPWDQLGDAPTNPENGDLLLQICSDDIYVVEHVLRHIEEELGARLTAVWTQLGSQRYTTRQGRTSRREGRALIGFFDGTSNLNPRHVESDRELVFVDPELVGTYPPLPQQGAQPGYPGSGPTFPGDLRSPPAHEPRWAKGGTYMVVRSSVIDTTRWDDQALGEQEHVIGRFKVSGASLDLADDASLLDAEPAFVANQGDVRVALASHVRKANPRRPEDSPRRVFRRGYPLIAATIDGIQRGLIFICFARSISTQFEFIERAWMTNANFPEANVGVDLFRQFEAVLCGGYYFVPSLADARRPWSWSLPW